ncbi:MAG: hypothetical protein HYY14_02030 [Candidatus Omnitrophica bacterium]|nr:hypothetical protein [Candidatus Omnitrophota bacterium]
MTAKACAWRCWVFALVTLCSSGAGAEQEDAVQIDLTVPPYEVIYDSYFREDPGADPDGAEALAQKSGLIALVGLTNTDARFANTVTVIATSWADPAVRHVQTIFLNPQESILFSPSLATDLEKGTKIPENIPFSEGRLRIEATRGIVGYVVTTLFQNGETLSAAQAPFTALSPPDSEGYFSLHLPHFVDTYAESGGVRQGPLTLISLVNADAERTNTVTLEYSSWSSPSDTYTETLSLEPGEAVLFSPASASSLEKGRIPPNVTFGEGAIGIRSVHAVAGKAVGFEYVEDRLVKISELPLQSEPPLNDEGEYKLYLPFAGAAGPRLYLVNLAETANELAVHRVNFLGQITDSPEGVALKAGKSAVYDLSRILPSELLPQEGYMTVTASGSFITSASQAPLAAPTPPDPEGSFVLYLPYFLDTYSELKGVKSGTSTLVSLVNAHAERANTVTLEYRSWSSPSYTYAETLSLEPGAAVQFSPASVTSLEGGDVLPKNVLFKEGELKITGTEPIAGQVTSMTFSKGQLTYATSGPLAYEAHGSGLDQSESLGIFGETAGVGLLSGVDAMQNVSFGTVSGAPDRRRVRTPESLLVRYSANIPFTIRVFTDNDTFFGTPPLPGLVGADNASMLPVKVWCQNYGPDSTDTRSGIPPDPNIALAWEGDTNLPPNERQPNWLNLPENDEHTADRFTWRRLTWHDGTERGDATLDPFGFPVFFAVDLFGVQDQYYRSEVVFELLTN